MMNPKSKQPETASKAVSGPNGQSGEHAVGAIVAFTDAERAQVNSIIGRQRNIEINLGKLLLQYEVARTGLLGAYGQTQQEIQTLVAAIAKTKGVDPSDPKKGTWDFSTENMTLTRTA